MGRFAPVPLRSPRFLSSLFGPLVALPVNMPKPLPRFLPESHVVVGIDFSEGAAAALWEARRLQEWLRARIMLVHVSAQREEEWSNDSAVRDWLAAHDVRASEVLILHGNPAARLVRFAISIRALAMVIGSHGRSGYQGLRLGGTAARVATIAECPVLVVNPRELPAAIDTLRREQPAAVRFPPSGLFKTPIEDQS